MKSKLVFVLGLLSTLSSGAYATDLRLELQNAAATQDPSFPDGQSSQLTHFSISCELLLGGEKIYVVDRRSVLTGMLAPRGQNQISFFSKDAKYLAGLRYVSSRPLWCEGQNLYLFGGWDGALFGDNKCASGLDCNVIQWDPKANQLKLYHEKKYGSSGGVESL